MTQRPDKFKFSRQYKTNIFGVPNFSFEKLLISSKEEDRKFNETNLTCGHSRLPRKLQICQCLRDLLKFFSLFIELETVTVIVALCDTWKRERQTILGKNVSLSVTFQSVNSLVMVAAVLQRTSHCFSAGGSSAGVHNNCHLFGPTGQLPAQTTFLSLSGTTTTT